MVGIDSTNKNSMASYRKARKELCDMGWLEYNNETHELYVCYDFLWQEVFSQERMDVISWIGQEDE